MSRKLPPETAGAVRDLARTGRDQREIARILNVSKGYVSSILREPWRAAAVACRPASRPVPAPTLPTVAPAPTPPVDVRAAQRAALDAEWYAAETPEARADIDVAILRLDDPEVDAALTRGEGVVMALAAGKHGSIVTALGTAKTLAELAVFVNDDDRTAAIGLLAGALEILHEQRDRRHTRPQENNHE